MTSEEAFEKSIKDRYGNPGRWQDTIAARRESWDAAVAWQKDQDLAIVETTRVRPPDYDVAAMEDGWSDACVKIERCIKESL